MSDASRSSVRLRFGTAVALTLLLGLVSLNLPDGRDDLGFDTGPAPALADGDAKFEVLEVRPNDPVPGGVMVVKYSGAPDGATVEVQAGKTPLEVIARKPGSVAVRLPEQIELGRAKIRAVHEADRSKPYEVRVKAQSWRKPFRNLVGGVALLVFGIRLLARGVREASGPGIARAFARLARRSPVAVGLGTVAGALMQSTTAVAALLSGLVSSRLLSVLPAALAFLGAQLGAALIPLLIGNLIEPREGLVLVALGMIWFLIGIDRRTTAFGRLLLGGGLIAFGVQVARPGLELLLSNPALLSTINELSANGVAGIAACAMLGATLVALLQGPVPLLVLAISVAETTGHWDLPTALALLSGTGLGAGLAALLTTPPGSTGKRLAELHLALGAASTLVAASTVGLWSQATDELLAPSFAGVAGASVLSAGTSLAIAFAVSQLALVVVLAPVTPLLGRLLQRLRPDEVALRPIEGGAAVIAVRGGLLEALRAERQALDHATELGRRGVRSSGRAAEHCLRVAEEILERLFSTAVTELPPGLEGSRLGRAAFACLQLQRGLEGLLRQAEVLTDARVTSAEAEGLNLLTEEQDRWLLEARELLSQGIDALEQGLQTGEPVDLEAARAKEILLNGIEARARAALLERDSTTTDALRPLQVLELVDGYEAAGNQLYRFCEALGKDPLSLTTRRPRSAPRHERPLS